MRRATRRYPDATMRRRQAPCWRVAHEMNPATKSRFFAQAPSPAGLQSRYFAARSSAPEPPSADAPSAVLPELPAAAGGASTSADCLPACPKCGLQLRHRTGRYGPFIGCSGFPSCRHTGRYGAGEPPPAAGPSGATKPRSSRSCLCVRVEMESETSVRVWCSQGEPQQQWLHALLARLTHLPALGTGPRADWLAQAPLLRRAPLLHRLPRQHCCIGPTVHCLRPTAYCLGAPLLHSTAASAA